jgi:Holliday junction resolvasome RuvABC endonuclease subunit
MNYHLVMDPSLTEFGYAIIDPTSKIVIEMDSIKTSKSEDVKKKLKKNTDDTTDRLKQIASVLTEKIKYYDIKIADFEIPVGSKSAIAGIALAGIRGLVVGVCVALQLEINTISAREVKLLLTGNRDASKEEILDKVIELIPTFTSKSVKYTKARKFACADAIAVYLAIQKQTN